MSELSNFISLVKNVGVSTSAYYYVQLPPLNGFNTENVNIMCNASGMPDITITAGDSKIYGEGMEVPNGATYGQLQLSFLVTNEFDTLGYFEAWSNMVYNRSNRTVGYYKDYALPVTVGVTDRVGNTRYIVSYMQAWPKTISTSGLSYDGHTPLVVNVTIQYKYWFSTIGGAVSEEPGWDGRPRDFILPEGLGNSTGVSKFGNFGTGLTSTGVGLDIYGGVGAFAASKLGPLVGSDLLGASNDVAVAIRRLDNMSDGTPVGALLSQYASQLGTSSSVMGFGIGQLGAGLTSVIAPAGAIASGVAGISGTLNSMNNLLGRMGIQTNLGQTSTTLNGIAGQISVISQLNGIPGAMGSLGASIGSISGDIAHIQRSLVNVPGATSSMSSTLGTLSNVFNGSGNKIGALSSMGW